MAGGASICLMAHGKFAWLEGNKSSSTDVCVSTMGCLMTDLLTWTGESSKVSGNHGYWVAWQRILKNNNDRAVLPGLVQV